MWKLRTIDWLINFLWLLREKIDPVGTRQLLGQHEAALQHYLAMRDEMS